MAQLTAEEQRKLAELQAKAREVAPTSDFVLLTHQYTAPDGTEYRKGDVVPLTDKDAKRLLKHGSVEEPGSSQKRAARNLQAKQAQLKAEQARIEAEIAANDAARAAQPAAAVPDHALEAGQQLDVAALNARQLNSELKKLGLDTDGSVDERRNRLNAALPQPTAGSPHATIDGADTPGTDVPDTPVQQHGTGADTTLQ